MKMSGAFPSKYLKVTDLNGKEPVVTISHVASEEVGQGEFKPVVYFQGAKKGLVLNKSNANTLVDLYGDESDAWQGKQCALFSIWTEFQGKQMYGLRVRAPQGGVDSNQAPAQQLGDPGPDNYGGSDDGPF